MGLLAFLLKLTPYYNKYKKYRQSKRELLLQKLEEGLIPIKVEFYKHFLQPNDLVFDVGANVGNRIDAFLLCKARVIAVEPQPVCANILQKKFSDKIIIENVGLSSKEGELEMHIANETTLSSFNKEFIEKTQKRFKNNNWNSSIRVPITTLNHLINKYGIPKFCKIDVEGYEWEVLKGLNTNIPFVSFEYCVPEMKENLYCCLTQFLKLDPKALFNYSIGETMQLELTEWINYEKFTELIHSNEFNKTSFGDIYYKSV